MNHRRQVVLAWIPVAVMIGVIVMESMTLSSNETGGILRPIMNRIWTAVLGHGIAESTFDLLHMAIRKTGHFVGYGLMCFFFFRAWRITFQERGAVAIGNAQWFWDQRWAGLALLGTILVASGDEIHQAFDPSRTGTFHDVVLDVAGGITALVIAWVWAKKRSRVGILTGSGD